MSLIIISPKINKKNFLELSFQNQSNLKFEELKICFSLIYSIKDLNGGKITKNIGRYYEIKFDDRNLLNQKNRILIIKLQESRLGTYNLSSGPEGIFIIDSNNKRINTKVKNLYFEEPIKEKNYSKKFSQIKCPIIPEPSEFNLSNEYIINRNKEFCFFDDEIKKFLNSIKSVLVSLNLNLNSPNGFKVKFINKEMARDEYQILIESNEIKVFSNSYGGKIYATISLIHLLFFYNSKLPTGKIDDKPRFSWRGMHLDCARQFYTIDQIKRLLIYMSLFKLNRFHWHLTDNEAWRLDLKSFPNLAKKSSYRGYDQIIPPFYGSGYDKYGGYYSEEDVKDLISFAKILNIEIMPEIDLPAHSWALIQIIPELIDRESNFESKDVGSYTNNTINPSLNETWIFLKKITEEISKKFSFDTIHVGLDERPNLAWQGSPKITELMKKNNFSSFDQVQDYYLNKVIKLLKENNKRTAAWNEAATKPYNEIGSGGGAGNIDKNCLIFAWEHPSVSSEVVKKGFEVVLCPGQKTYFDMAYNNSTNERGICWAATIEASEIHAWKPLSIIEPIYHNRVLGIQGQLWSETITIKEYFDYLVNPRLATLSEVAWCRDKRRDWEAFRSSLSQSLKMLSIIGWKFHNF